MTEAVLVAEIAEIALAVAETVAAMVVKSEANVVAIAEVAAVVGLPAADFPEADFPAVASPAAVGPLEVDFRVVADLPAAAAAGLIRLASSNGSIRMATG